MVKGTLLLVTEIPLVELYSFSLLTHPVPFVKHMDDVGLPLLVLKQIISALLDANRIFVFSCHFEFSLAAFEAPIHRQATVW